VFGANAGGMRPYFIFSLCDPSTAAELPISAASYASRGLLAYAQAGRH
jgi:hypothetical protein